MLDRGNELKCLMWLEPRIWVLGFLQNIVRDLLVSRIYIQNLFQKSVYVIKQHV